MIINRDKYIKVSTDQFPYLKYVYDYTDFLLFDVTYSKDNYEVGDLKLINKFTEEEIKEITEKNMKNIFNFNATKKMDRSNRFIFFRRK